MGWTISTDSHALFISTNSFSDSYSIAKSGVYRHCNAYEKNGHNQYNHNLFELHPIFLPVISLTDIYFVRRGIYYF